MYKIIWQGVSAKVVHRSKHPGLSIEPRASCAPDESSVRSWSIGTRSIRVSGRALAVFILILKSKRVWSIGCCKLSHHHCKLSSSWFIFIFFIWVSINCIIASFSSSYSPVTHLRNTIAGIFIFGKKRYTHSLDIGWEIDMRVKCY